jgi:hypothetical protein
MALNWKSPSPPMVCFVIQTERLRVGRWLATAGERHRADSDRRQTNCRDHES